MKLVSKEWITISKDYCEHYDIDDVHYGEIKRLKKDAPESIKQIYAKTMKEWKNH